MESKSKYNFEVAIDIIISNRIPLELREWFNRTLFIKCTEDQARSVFHALTSRIGTENVRISKAGNEYAIDFI